MLHLSAYFFCRLTRFVFPQQAGSTPNRDHNDAFANNKGPTGLTGGPGLMQKSLLAPMRQWCAHESRISSIAAASYRGKADLIVTAGEDCNVHLWTVAGALVGTFGQVTVDYYEKHSCRRDGWGKRAAGVLWAQSFC